jgi:mRNA interferase MazF
MPYLRGQVYWCLVSDASGRRPWLIISNNGRNSALDSVLAAMITTTRKDIDTFVPLTAADAPVAGYVNTDCIEQPDKDWLEEQLGALSQGTMRNVDKALKLALAIRDEPRTTRTTRPTTRRARGS